MTVTLTTEKTVRELALEIPAATRVFENLGIDYCCGGNKSIEELAALRIQYEAGTGFPGDGGAVGACRARVSARGGDGKSTLTGMPRDTRRTIGHGQKSSSTPRLSRS